MTQLDYDYKQLLYDDSLKSRDKFDKSMLIINLLIIISSFFIMMSTNNILYLIPNITAILSYWSNILSDYIASERYLKESYCNDTEELNEIEKKFIKYIKTVNLIYYIAFIISNISFLIISYINI